MQNLTFHFFVVLVPDFSPTVKLLSKIEKKALDDFLYFSTPNYESPSNVCIIIWKKKKFLGTFSKSFSHENFVS